MSNYKTSHTYFQRVKITQERDKLEKIGITILHNLLLISLVIVNTWRNYKGSTKAGNCRQKLRNRSPRK